MRRSISRAEVEALSSDAHTTDLALLAGAELRDALATSAAWLEQNAEAINALNVFPVPDGDTGLNMALTLRAAVDAVAGDDPGDLATMLGRFAHGALMGARGNSGVIFAQFLRGMAAAAPRTESLDGVALAALLRAGTEAAYRAVASPVEGTILTVARAAADAAHAAASSHASVISVLAAAHDAAQIAVDRTPDQLPVLREAGVVDAGGEGLRVVLEGLLLHLRGESLSAHPPRLGLRADLSAFQHEADTFGYCTEVLFRPGAADLGDLQERVAALGTSVIVVSDGDVVKLHVHTLRPGGALDLATELGEIVRVKVENMRLQFAAFADTAGGPPAPGMAVVAVAQGAGFQEIFTSFGATVVTGGQSMNPAVGEIASAIERAARAHVVVLPNNPNVILTAEQAARRIADRTVTVLPTHTMCEGIAAALAIAPDGDADTCLAAATSAAARCVTIELTRSARATSVSGAPIPIGAWIAIVAGEIIAGPDRPDTLVDQALAKLAPRSFDVATIYIGADGAEGEGDAIRDVIASRMHVSVEQVSGGQPHYPYIISLE